MAKRRTYKRNRKGQFAEPESDGRLWQYVSADRIVTGDQTRHGTVTSVAPGPTAEHPNAPLTPWSDLPGSRVTLEFADAPTVTVFRAAPIEVLR
ncbi:hypothetical protein MMAG44476_32079 [Mycolicibacterium mageritense DSM 44476 = CIP 104973]|uniref:Uncharacterized protein n=1 Tax=Mycolicibacterium mageritense TaxID=53462 RepID=A0ABM7I151_MYCME|nr:hypothetical protein [Mycolicibacterium mageritense]BBX36591.1 hypothetical protein MMAGJ_58730 [Mycolicibacterium mageritense]CDO24694.1 hypothetical protein BN978_05194 [Mycolicibacterium mageritense DSM 44476 = CIP 104973]